MAMRPASAAKHPDSEAIKRSLSSDWCTCVCMVVNWREIDGKPILDALKDIVYDDDKQVRSVRIVALPLDDAFRLPGEASQETFARLLECQEFLVVIKEGLAFSSGISLE